jgi:autotransporter-associated beta strand protein
VTIDGGKLRNTANIASARSVSLGSGGGTIDTSGGFLTLQTPVDGAGGLTKTGGNILTLAGAQTYAGATTVSGGMLKIESGSLASPSVSVAAGGQLLFALGGSYAGDITGQGTFEHEFAGTMVYTGDATHTGGTIVHSGKMQVDGSISGAVTVHSSGTLGGNGSVGGTTIESGGNIAPGSSAGELTVLGDLTLAGTFAWELSSLVDNTTGDAGDHWDLITVSGHATLTGGSLSPGFGAGDEPDSGDAFWDDTHTWTILSAAGFTGSLSTPGGYADGGFATQVSGGSLQLVWTPGPLLLLGDWDFSGVVANTDIQAMLDALVDLDGYKTTHGIDDEQLKDVGDLNGDDAVTNADIQAMLDYLTGGGGLAEIQALSLEVFGDAHVLDAYATSVPEPSTALFFTLAGAGLLLRGGRRA